MTPLSRRSFLKGAGMGAAVAGLASANLMTLHANPLGLPIGSQTWPHRAIIKAGRFAELAQTLAGIGVQSLEMCSPIDYEDFAPLKDGKQVKRILADHGLTCVSSHFGMDELRKRHSESIAWAHDVGITQMITATLSGPKNPTLDDVKRAADEYNKIAAVSAQAGIQQGLHNEDFECSMVGGRRTYDVLFELLDPSLVKFQFQMSTISLGFVAADYFTKYPGRFFSMHVQDVDLAATKAKGDGSRPVYAPVGKGGIDWKKTFETAKIGGVKNYFVEMDMELTKASVPYLKALKV
jgi:sugar phosphate isomerase/epimerase